MIWKEILKQDLNADYMAVSEWTKQQAQNLNPTSLVNVIRVPQELLDKVDRMYREDKSYLTRMAQMYFKTPNADFRPDFKGERGQYYISGFA